MIIGEYFKLKACGTAVMMIDKRFIDIDIDEMSKWCTNYISAVTYVRLEYENRLQVHIDMFMTLTIKL